MEATPAILHAKGLLLLLAVILGVGSLAGFFARALRIPDIVLFMFAGMSIGSQGMGWINVPVDSTLNQLLLIFGSCYILFDGGASIRLQVLRAVLPTLLLISTVGVLITAACTAVFAHWLLNLPWLFALLLGATIASTDPATLVPVFKQVKVRAKVAQLVMSESAFNDAMGAILTFTVLGIVVGNTDFSFSHSAFELLKQSLLGLIGGVILGYLACLLIAHERYSFLAEYAPVVTLITVAAAYLSVDRLEASGFMAVFAFGIMLSNKAMLGFYMAQDEEEKLEDFILTTSLIMRMFIFILLGSQVDFDLLSLYFQPALALALLFMLVVRPIAVFACALPDRKANWTLNELLFICWTRETGVIPGALAGMLVGMKVPHAQVIASVTFMTILITITLQASTTKWLAEKLGVCLNNG